MKNKQPITRVFFDTQFPEWNDKKVASRFNPDEVAGIFAESGVESAVVFAKCQYGNFYYDTKRGHKHAGLGNLDLLRSMTEKFHRHSIEVLAYYSTAWDELQGTLHPDWLTEDFSGKRTRGAFRWKTLCINSPYRALVKEDLCEIAAETDVDGFWIDMTIIGKDRCYCPYCDKKFRALYGKGIREARGAGMDIELAEFRYNYIEEFYDEIYKELRRIKPSLNITNNYWGYPYQSRNMGSRAVGALKQADFITGEAYVDWTGLEAPSFFSRFLSGAAGGRPFEALVGRFINTWDFTRKTPDQMFFEAMTIFSLGGTVTIDDEPFYDGTIDLTVYRTLIGPAFRAIKKLSHTIRGESLKFAAIFHSQATKDLIPEDAPSPFIRNISGAYKLLQERHIPVNFVFDESLTEEEIRRYRVILLPGAAALGEKTRKILEDYVRNGGVVTGFGRNAFFENLFSGSVVYKGLSEYSLSYIPLEGEKTLVRGAYCRYVQSGAGCSGWETGAPVIDPIAETSVEVFFHNNLPSPYLESSVPSYYIVPLGKGWVIQYNQPISESYAKQRGFAVRDAVIAQILRRTGKPDFWIDAPARVDTVAYHDKEARRFYIHLSAFAAEASLACGLFDTTNGNFERPYAMMENRDPVKEITVHLAAEKEIKSVISLYEKNEPRWEQTAETLVIRTPLELWDVIEAEY
ncbi:MAG: alpha-L-fucosidase [Treponema sp.]|jgi:hypothetical protein|nr:alpha-L-fucosidase [Treponema sp.]